MSERSRGQPDDAGNPQPDDSPEYQAHDAHVFEFRFDEQLTDRFVKVPALVHRGWLREWHSNHGQLEAETAGSGSEQTTSMGAEKAKEAPKSAQARKATHRKSQMEKGLAELSVITRNDDETRETVRACAKAAQKRYLHPWLKRVIHAGFFNMGLAKSARDRRGAIRRRFKFRSAVLKLIEYEELNDMVIALAHRRERAPSVRPIVGADIDLWVTLSDLATEATEARRLAFVEMLITLSKAADATFQNVTEAVRDPGIMELSRQANEAMGGRAALERTVGILEAGGLRGRILRWLLGL